MKRALPLILGLMILLLAAVLIGPSFVDWNKYKPQILEQAKAAGGYDVRIDGDIKLSVLPMPTLKVQSVSVAAPRGSEQNLLTMEEAQVSVNLLPLISGDISINTVRLVKPDVRLETLADGSNSWMSDKLITDQKQGASGQDAGAPSDRNDTQGFVLDTLVIEDGRVSYVNRASGASHAAEAINLDIGIDSLNGPFSASGALTYNKKPIELDISTEKMAGAKKEFPAEIQISLPQSGASAAFKGVVALEPFELQGKTDVTASNLAALLKSTEEGAEQAGLKKALSFSGLVTANENSFSTQETEVSFGEAKGTGGLSVTGLKDQNPVKLSADLAFAGLIDLDQLLPEKNKGREPSVEEKVARGEKLSPAPTFVPETLSMPFPLEATVKLTADGIKSWGREFKGVSLTLIKDGPAIDIAASILDIPGKTKADIKGDIRYANTSHSGDKGVTYADPAVAFTVTGTSEQLPTLLRAFATDQGSNPALELYKTAQFDLKGNLTPTTVTLADSTVKLDQTMLALGGKYRPNGAAGRPDITIDLTTDTVDIDAIQSRLKGQNKQAVQKSEGTAGKPDMKAALEPVRNFSIPVNLTFDISAQNAIFDAQQISGIRLQGRMAGSSLNLTNVSAQNFRGAAASLKGSVANLQDLSGIDLTFYGRTSDLKSLLESFQMDTSKLPQGLSAAEANIAAKGKADALSFKADVAAMNGSLEASGNMTGLLDTPAFSNLLLAAEHPNLVRAIQIMNPSFTGGPGLEQPFSFSTKAVQNGNIYDLSDMNLTIGKTTLGGTIKADMTGAKPAIGGAIQAGTIALDDLLGAKKSAASGGSGGGSSSGGGKWSRATLETGWMHAVNLDLSLSAELITYGGWNFTKPNTKINLKDGVLSVDNLQSGLFGGNAALNAKVQDPADARQPLTIALDTKMTNVALESLAFALSGSRKIRASGDVSLDMNVQTSGLSPHALVSGLSGKANLNGTEVIMKGFDLAQISLAFVDTGKPMDRVQSLVGGAVSGGETRFDTVRGAYDISQGVANISSMEMDGPAANIKSRGNVNLPQWVIDTVHTITFKQAKDAGAFDVTIRGPLDSPANTFGRGLFNDVLTRRLQQKAVEKLPDVLGDDLTGKLQGLGILPPKQQPAPTPAPTSAPEGAAPAPEPAAPAPQAAPASPEEQIRGVLDGLLR